MKLVFSILFFLLLLPPLPVLAAASEEYLSDYEAVFYDSADGLAAAEINAIAQTPDGYLWAGSYSGLYRYDGVRFEKTVPAEGIYNVMVLFVDREGRLWIGTNDTGLCRFSPDSGETRFFTAKDGLKADAIRSLAEDEKGNLYVGTVAGMSRIDPEGRCVSEKAWEALGGVTSLSCMEDGTLAGVTDSGRLFALRNGKLIGPREYGEGGIYYTKVCAMGEGILVAGTSSSYIELLTLAGDHLQRDELIFTENISYFNGFFYDRPREDCFFCAENGLGCLKKDGDLIDLRQEDFESSVSDALVDYQGNIWFASNKQGILEYAPNPFRNLFVRGGVSPEVVNTVAVSGQELYIGTDDGVFVLDERTAVSKDYPFLERLKGVRVRHIAADKKGRLWFSTYGKEGLICVEKPGRNAALTAYNEETAGTLGGRFRQVLELSDGTIYASSNQGINVIREGKVVSTIGTAQGLAASQILTMVESPGKDAVLAGTDGDGIYLLKEDRIAAHIGEEQGLETAVVLRIIPYAEGFFYVTSNSLYYDPKGDGSPGVVRLDRFPYSNNYDMYFSPEGEAWISSSAGIYVVDAERLIENGDYHYTLLDRSRGFNTSLTANAWNTLSSSGELLLCCTDGIRAISTKDYDRFDTDFFLGVNRILCDDAPILPGASGTYVIPAGTGRVEIRAAVLNYTLSNPLVRIFLEGAADEGLTVYQEELTDLSYTNLPYGEYTLHIQLLDAVDHTPLRDESFKLIKEAHFTELREVHAAAVALLVLLAGFIVWRFMQATIIRRQYEEIRLAKDEAERANSAKSRFLANMSHEIRTPINTIMGMDEMILREDREEDKGTYTKQVVGYAVSIKRAADSLLSLVNDILDLSKIESGKMNLVEQEYGTEELLRAVAAMIRIRANEKDLGFTMEIDAALPKRLYGDDGKLKQVLLNLLTNAVKYTEKGSFLLSVKVLEDPARTQPGGNAAQPSGTADARRREAPSAPSGNAAPCRIRFSVKDTGIGIRPEDMNKLFSAFERLDEKRNSGIQGTGLGLDISRQFVELMGGRLQVESVYGEGSEFWFTLSQRIINPEPVGSFKEDDFDEEKAAGVYVPLFTAPDAQVLLVDDDKMNLKVIQRLLQGTMVQITTAMSGLECLNALEEGRFDIVLLDHMMPGMDGIETVHRIREKDTALPVIALTANSAENGEQFYLSAGFNGYLSKPVDGKKLEEMIRGFLPEELLKAPAAAEKPSGEEEAAAIPSALFAIPDFDPAVGIKNCGSPEAFLASLNIFSDTLNAKAREIEEAYGKEDWPFYTIKVHALKSSARILGAEKLSGLAERLENAGKAGELSVISKNTEELLRMYRGLGEALSALKPAEKEPEKKAPLPEGMLEEAGEALREFVSMLDYDSVEMVLLSLREYALPPEKEKMLDTLHKMLKELDWEGIEELIKKDGVE